ncbi:Adenosine receptor A1 [Habropoda laboriosa]|uniref:Adenosine receptor A1 n=2 Tax=Habropoda laboriosa TaxID=597456 RepID=A0A0L7REP1_9HYME|nr:Adenosine receptor A1 [Habropoda laboriosa]
MNLTVSNLLVCAIMNPLLIMDVTSTTSDAPAVESQSVGSICAMSEGAVAIVTTSSVLSVLLIAVDQYFAVVDPLRYRARVDKLKSGVLIMSIWLISIIFGFVAFFNPNPQSFWLSCISRNRNWPSNITTFDSLTKSMITIVENETTEQNVSSIADIVETIETIRFDGDLNLIENTTVIFDTFIGGTITYGFVYAILYSIFVYFIPFGAICWIYVSIYVAAHRNSERARRSGSRPILSSASFTEEQNGPSRLQRLQTDTIEDFRKLPKISSLSSIDETSETMQPTGQVSRRRSFSSSLEIEVSSPPVDDNACSGIVFTVGLQRLDVPAQCTNSQEDSTMEDKDAEQSSKDAKENERTPAPWISRNFVDENSDSEDDTRFECFDNLDALENKFALPARSYQSDTLKAGETVEVEGRLDRTSDQIKQNEATVISGRVNGGDQGEGRLLQTDVYSDSEYPSQGDSRTPRNTAEVKPNCRLSTFVGRDVACENATLSAGSNKTEKDSASGTESSACLLTPIVTITPAPSRNENLHRVSSVRSTSSYINSLKDRISNGSIFRHREEARAARISALVIVMGLICWLPYVILLVMKNLPRSTGQYLPHIYDVLASSLLILGAYISPLLFGYRSKRVKRELRRFFCFRRELSYKNNRSLMAKKVLKRRHSSTLSHFEMDHKYNIFNCVYGRTRWPKEKVQFVQVPDTALAVETCRSSFSSGASTQISSTSTEEC